MRPLRAARRGWTAAPHGPLPECASAAEVEGILGGESAGGAAGGRAPCRGRWRGAGAAAAAFALVLGCGGASQLRRRARLGSSAQARGAVAGRSVLVAVAGDAEDDAPCHTAEDLEECHLSVVWAMEHGIAEHPEWYPGLTSSSAFEEFQAVLHREGHGNCPRPCAVGALPDDEGAGAGEPKGRCRTAEFGTPCYQRVMWVMRTGILEHPEWYPTVDIVSDFEEVQAALAEKNESGCGRPCSQTFSGKAGKASVGGICHRLAPIPPDGVPSVWPLPKSDQTRCYNWLRDRNFVGDSDRELKRNWCWVGLKEFGCHRHFYDHLTWAQMQHQAVVVGATRGLQFRPLQGPELCDRPVLGGPRRGGWNNADRDAASAWFEQNAVVYVLSLPGSPRRDTVSRCMEKRAIPFEFSDGVDMRQPGALEAAKAEGLVPEEFDFEAAQAEAYSARQGMGTDGSIAGTVGCASAHFRAQRRGAKDERNRSVVVVFEDDVCPERDFVLKLWNVVTHELPCDWQVVSLSSRCPFGRCISPHLTRVQPDVNEPEWRCRHGVNYGFQGVIYKASEVLNVQKLWQPVVFDATRPHCLDLDVALASISNRARFYAVPASHSPGFLRELPQGSARVDVNVQAQGGAAAGVAADAPAGTATLWCFLLTFPRGDELELVKAQLLKGMGVFACDGHAAFSSKKVMLGPGVFTTPVGGDMNVKKGGPYNIALNTEVLLRVWSKVWDMNEFSSFDWVVKVDPDAVFFPSRLRSHASITPGGALYLNNCGAGLHGPIEAMTREAAWLFRDGDARCREEKVTDWTTQGEDDYVMGCLGLLGAQQYNDFGVLSEVACGEDPSPCVSGKVAFHPFKTVGEWFRCAAEAAPLRA